MYDTPKPAPTHVRWLPSGRFADRGIPSHVLAGSIGAGRCDNMDTWYLPPASIAA